MSSVRERNCAKSSEDIEHLSRHTEDPQTTFGAHTLYLHCTLKRSPLTS